MPNEEIAQSVVGPTIEEIKQEIEGLAESAMAPVQSALDLPENAQSAVVQVKDAVASALDTFVQSGSADQMRGYANEGVGKTKLAVALATQSPNSLWRASRNKR
jgi:uncharacterized protein YjbJ (UPF0337 family)